MNYTYKAIITGFIFSLYLILGVGVASLPAQAESLDSFDAVIHVPDGQSEKNLSYFDLTLEPGKEENLIVTLTNKGEKELKLKALFNRAVTNSAGVIEYSGINEDSSTSAPYDIEKLVKLSDAEITLAPNESKDITLNVTMPKDKFSGVLAGGVYFEEISTEKVEGNIKNVFSREIAVLLRSDAAEVAPELTIKEARSAQVNYRNVIETDIENTSAVYVKNIEIDYSVLLDGKEVVSGKKEKLSMAPNTQMPFRIPFSGEEFGDGTYTVNITVKNDQGEWTGSPTFDVTKKEADDYNEKDVTVQKAGFDIPWSTVALVTVLLVLGGVTLLMINRNKKLKKQLAKKRKKRKKRPTSVPKSN